MTYKLVRYEQQKDHNGKITAIFVSVSLTDDLGNSWSQEYWLTEAEIAKVLIKESNLTAILETVCAKGEKNLTNYLATKPQESIVADSTKLNSFIINAANVAAEKGKYDH